MDSDIVMYVFVAIIVGATIYYYWYYYDSKNDKSFSSDKLVKKVRQAIRKSQMPLSLQDLKEIEAYKFHQKDSLFDIDAEDWNTDNAKVKDLCLFGFKLLQKYAVDSKAEKCLQISTDIVLRINHIFNKLLEIKVVHSNKPVHKAEKTTKEKDRRESKESPDASTTGTEKKGRRRDNDSEVPEVKKVLDRYTFSTYIPRLMVMYEYIGKDACIKRYVCHSIITKLIPALNKSLDKTESGPNMVYFSLPRLLTNYLFDQTSFINEQHSDLFQDLQKVYNIPYNLSNELKDGVYEDGSCIYYNKLARYANLFSITGFYEDLFASLGIKYNLHDVVEPIIEKLLHPTIPYVTFGLFGNDGDRSSKNWWNIKGKLGIAIMPFIGLGLFKTERFMFSLRIQRPEIAAYFKISDKSKDEFALGWMQLRRMYLADCVYPNPLTWETMLKEPGIISVEHLREPIVLKPKGNKSNLIFAENVNSLIGRLPEDELMFWMNQYQFPEYYSNITIIEMGVVTDNGVEIYYCTDKEIPSKQLMLRVRDDENTNLHVKPQSSDGFVTLDREGQILRMVFDETTKIPIRKNETTNEMQFEYNSNTYTVKIETPNLSYVVNVAGKDGSTDIFGGSSKSELNDNMTVFPGTPQEKKLIRSRESYMYVHQ